MGTLHIHMYWDKSWYMYAYTAYYLIYAYILLLMHLLMHYVCIHTYHVLITSQGVLHIRSGTLGFQLCRVRRFFTGDGPAWTLHCIMCTDWPFWVVLWEGLKFQVTSLWRDNAAHTVIPFFACLPYYYWLNEVDPFCSSSTPVRSLQSKLHVCISYALHFDEV